jgi:hypothetical protein
VTCPESDKKRGTWTAEDVKGMAMNPVYAGVAPYPKMIEDERWIAVVRRIVEDDGPDQFLVNLLYLLRRTYGCVEWGGQVPPGTNGH